MLLQEHDADLASSSNSGVSNLGTYACAVGSANLDVASPCK
jgi:hypothetical protein